MPLELVQKATGRNTTDAELKHYFRPGREGFRLAIDVAMPKLLTSGEKTAKDGMRELFDEVKPKAVPERLLSFGRSSGRLLVVDLKPRQNIANIFGSGYVKPMAVRVWYDNYDVLRSKVEELRRRFLERCAELAVDANVVAGEFSREIVVRAVHESNWQEGIELDAGRTQKLANAAFDEIEDVVGPHLDTNKILRFHRSTIVRLKRDGASVEEVAAYNLARAHHAITWIGSDLAERQAASLAQALRGLRGVYEQVRGRFPAEGASTIERGFALVDPLERSEEKVGRPMTAPPHTSGHLTTELLKLAPDNLLNPVRSTYIHFLHRLVLMGIMSPEKTGRFRPGTVHVGNPDLYFPVPSAVPAMMKEFCEKFPTILPSTVTYDPILVAARTSHKFVSIHPYEDGNGRVSRLLMNLVLWGHAPFVYLKADKKGRHRYGQAIRRADRGDIKPLGSLIAMSLIEIFEKLIGSLGRS